MADSQRPQPKPHPATIANQLHTVGPTPKRLNVLQNPFGKDLSLQSTRTTAPTCARDGLWRSLAKWLITDRGRRRWPRSTRQFALTDRCDQDKIVQIFLASPCSRRAM